MRGRNSRSRPADLEVVRIQRARWGEGGWLGSLRLLQGSGQNGKESSEASTSASGKTRRSAPRHGRRGTAAAHGDGFSVLGVRRGPKGEEIGRRRPQARLFCSLPSCRSTCRPSDRAAVAWTNSHSASHLGGHQPISPPRHVTSHFLRFSFSPPRGKPKSRLPATRLSWREGCQYGYSGSVEKSPRSATRAECRQSRFVQASSPSESERHPLSRRRFPSPVVRQLTL